MTRILIVDDEAKIREVVKEYATLNGYEVLEASNGLEALDMIESTVIDLVILDIMMPTLDGYEVCKRIEAKTNIPVIMLSARTEEYDKLFGFELGVDDYVVKPFSPKELMARVKVVLERGKNPNKLKYSFEGLEIDEQGRSVKVDGAPVSLTPKELDLLLYMVHNQNIALSREKLLSEVWDYDYYGDDRTVDTHIKMLRHNLGPYRDYIVTVRGMGYKFETRS